MKKNEIGWLRATSCKIDNPLVPGGKKGAGKIQFQVFCKPEEKEKEKYKKRKLYIYRSSGGRDQRKEKANPEAQLRSRRKLYR